MLKSKYLRLNSCDLTFFRGGILLPGRPDSAFRVQVQGQRHGREPLLPDCRRVGAYQARPRAAAVRFRRGRHRLLLPENVQRRRARADGYAQANRPLRRRRRLRPHQRQPHLRRILFPERHARLAHGLRLRIRYPGHGDLLLRGRERRRQQVRGIPRRLAYEQPNLQEAGHRLLRRNLQRHVPARIRHGSPGDAHHRSPQTG